MKKKIKAKKKKFEREAFKCEVRGCSNRACCIWYLETSSGVIRKSVCFKCYRRLLENIRESHKVYLPFMKH